MYQEAGLAQRMWQQVRRADGWLRPAQGLNSHAALGTGTRDPARDVLDPDCPGPGGRKEDSRSSALLVRRGEAPPSETSTLRDRDACPATCSPRDSRGGGLASFTGVLS